MSRAHTLLGPMIALALACTPTPAGPAVEPLEVEPLREAFAMPTAIVDEASADAVADEVIANQAVYEVVNDYLAQVFAAADEARTGFVVLADSTDPNTSTVYLLFACPGPSLGNQDVGFAFGSMRVDAEVFTPDTTQAIALTGHGSLLFEGCQLEDHIVDGPAPIYRDEETLEVLIAPDIGYALVDEPENSEASRSLDDPIQLLADGLSSVLYTLDDGGTLVLESDPLTAELRLRGVNGSLLCALDDEGFSCLPP